MAAFIAENWANILIAWTGSAVIVVWIWNVLVPSDDEDQS